MDTDAGDGYAQTRVDAVVIAGSGQRQSRRTTQAGRKRQKERIAAALPLLAAIPRETVIPTSLALFAVLRRGLALGGGALTLGVAGSLIYESQVMQAEAEAPVKERYGRVSVYLAGDLSEDGSFLSVSTLSGARGPESVQDGTLLPPPCSSGRVRRR